MSAQAQTGASPRSVAVADINGDGQPDLLVANYGSGTVSVLLGNGNGSFLPPLAFATGTEPISVAVADLNDDGLFDLVVADDGDDIVNAGDHTVSVFLNQHR